MLFDIDWIVNDLASVYSGRAHPVYPGNCPGYNVFVFLPPFEKEDEEKITPPSPSLERQSNNKSSLLVVVVEVNVVVFVDLILLIQPYKTKNTTNIIVRKRELPYFDDNTNKRRTGE